MQTRLLNEDGFYSGLFPGSSIAYYLEIACFTVTFCLVWVFSFFVLFFVKLPPDE